MAPFAEELDLLDPLASSQFGKVDMNDSTFRRENTDLTRVLGGSGIIVRPKLNPLSEEEKKSNLPLGIRRSIVNSSKDVLNGIKSPTFPSKTSPTEAFIKNNIDGGIEELIGIVRSFESSSGFYQIIPIEKIINKFKLSSISPTTLKMLGIEMSEEEAFSFGLSTYEIKQLKTLGLINEDRKFMKERPYIYRGMQNERYVIKHFGNLISVQKPNISDGNLENWINFFARIVDGKISFFRADYVEKYGVVFKISPNLIISELNNPEIKKMF